MVWSAGRASCSGLVAGLRCCRGGALASVGIRGVLKVVVSVVVALVVNVEVNELQSETRLKPVPLSRLGNLLVAQLVNVLANTDRAGSSLKL